VKFGTYTSVLLGLAAGLPSAAIADTPPGSGWQFEATPYLWVAGFSGWSRVGTRTPTANLDASFSDVLKNLNFGGMGSFEARYGRWGVVVDTIYVKVSKTSDPLLGGALGTVRLKLNETILQAAAAYRVIDSAVMPIDVLIGVRYAYVDGDLSYSGGRLLPGGRSGDQSANWTDGFLAVRGAYMFSDKWSVSAYADAGTGGTKHSWQFLSGVNYNFSKTIVAKMGYRILSMDYEQPAFLYNIKTQGPYAGVGIRF
jgi:opacity protein-like surface antigen